MQRTPATRKQQKDTQRVVTPSVIRTENELETDASQTVRRNRKKKSQTERVQISDAPAVAQN